MLKTYGREKKRNIFPRVLSFISKRSIFLLQDVSQYLLLLNERKQLINGIFTLLILVIEFDFN